MRYAGPHTLNGTSERAAWLTRMVDGVVIMVYGGPQIIDADGTHYIVKHFLCAHLKPGEHVRFVPRLGLWRGALWAAEVHRHRKRRDMFPPECLPACPCKRQSLPVGSQ